MPGSARSAHEREKIRVGIETEDWVPSIVRGLGRSPSTISREVRRHGGRTRYRAAAFRLDFWGFSDHQFSQVKNTVPRISNLRSRSYPRI
jgi:IS30 family transposase